MTTARRDLHTRRTPLAPAARRAAARMVLAADKAAGRQQDPHILAIAEGRDENLSPESLPE
ncbi:hypothetical protein QNM97_21040 [Gordonia sp. L191]|uniref:hypothetical protein n=1 Tax=Gordonia sp. L191 TaxID=2982699 RepID=UPI0024C0BE45|nr:hypothetical protein [Gordonia sp. L191]WHU46448.1 hypothetical protein QNM97_21040 [Gordonia sp. L191]